MAACPEAMASGTLYDGAGKRRRSPQPGQINFFPRGGGWLRIRKGITKPGTRRPPLAYKRTSQPHHGHMMPPSRTPIPSSAGTPRQIRQTRASLRPWCAEDAIGDEFGPGPGRGRRLGLRASVKDFFAATDAAAAGQGQGEIEFFAAGGAAGFEFLGDEAMRVADGPHGEDDHEDESGQDAQAEGNGDVVRPVVGPEQGTDGKHADERGQTAGGKEPPCARESTEAGA